MWSPPSPNLSVGKTKTVLVISPETTTSTSLNIVDLAGVGELPHLFLTESKLPDKPKDPTICYPSNISSTTETPVLVMVEITYPSTNSLKENLGHTIPANLTSLVLLIPAKDSAQMLIPEPLLSIPAEPAQLSEKNVLLLTNTQMSPLDIMVPFLELLT